MRSAIFALVAGVRLPISICSTAESRTERIVETNSGSNFAGDNFGDGDNFRIWTALLLMNGFIA
jgi:hypothetical protein